jgi:cobyrinic acid a,c-diamide synthase
VRSLVVAGTHSGVGKTTVATGIMAALARRGYRVQPFKVGPDYVDPSYHTAACGRPSRNLDSWLLEEGVIGELFHRATRGCDAAVVEGVMGLYDGFGGDDEAGSTAHLAKLLRLPVVLVVDASAAARSVGASVLGFKEFDPQLNLAGVVLNGIAGDQHLEFVKPSLSRAGLPLLGYLPIREDLALPERHLGLIPTVEGRVAEDFYSRLAQQVEGTVAVDRVLAIASQAGPPTRDAPLVFPESPTPAKAAIAVATDKAFSFYYADSLDLLEAWGAELVRFSPLADRGLPPGVGGLYIGGGFPELYAAELSENHAMREAVRRAAESGLPTYAECGGLMYLAQTLEDLEGHTYPMAGVTPGRSFLKGTHLTLGYRTVRAFVDSPLMEAGETVRGHEFHLSALGEEPRGATPAYQMLDQQGRKEGFRVSNVLSSYVHLHFASKRGLAERFVDSCVRCHAVQAR